MIKKIKSWLSQPANLILIVSLFLTIIVLWPIVNSGLVADDSMGRTANANLIAEQGWTGYLKTVFVDQILLGIRSGRVHLTAPLITGPNGLLFGWNTTILKLATIGATLVAQITLWFFLKKIIPDDKSPLRYLPVLVLPLLWQVRPYHDPFLIYAGDFQWAWVIFLLSLIAWVNWLRQRKKSQLVISLILFFIFANFHEMNLVFGILYPLLLIMEQKKEAFKFRHWNPILIYLLIAILGILGPKILQPLVDAPAQEFAYDGTAVNWQAKRFLQALVVQTSGVIPGQYAASRSGQEVMSYHSDLWLNNLPYLLLFGLGLALLAIYVIKHQKSDSKKNNWWQTNWYILIGVAIVVAGALPAAVVSKYQSDLLFYGMKGGIVNLIIFYQYFGAAMVISGLLFFLKKIVDRWWWLEAILIVPFAGGLYLNLTANQAVVMEINKAYGDHQFLLNAAVETGFLEELANQEWIWLTNERQQNYYYVDNKNVWRDNLNYSLDDYSVISQIEQRALLAEPATKSPQLVDIELWQQNRNLEETDQPLVWLYYDQVGPTSGYLIKAQVTGLTDQSQPLSNKVELLYVGPALNDNWPTPVYPQLKREIFTWGQNINPAGQIENWQELVTVVRNRTHNSFAWTIEAPDDRFIILETVIPTIIQADRHLQLEN